MQHGPPRPTEGQLQELAAQWGLIPTDAPQERDERLALWPENAIPVMIFEAMLSQWRMGMGGPIGLDYSALPAVGRLLRIRPRALRDAFPGIRLLETEALSAIAERRR